jgi:hypothetical protein
MASKLTSGDISEITRQADVLSKPLRDNFTNLKNKTNEVIDDLAAVSIGTTNAETTAARPYHASLKERLDDITSGKPNYRDTITSLVTESTPNAMTVEIAAGAGQVGGITVNWSAATTGTITAPSVNPRIDIVVVNSDNTITVVTGAEAATPLIPTVTNTQLALARIDLTVGMATITNSDIINYNGYVWSQIGEIIAIHPGTKTAYLPNSYHYSRCDGMELLDTTYFDIALSTSGDDYTPDLTDERFLMGDSAFDYGGYNGNHVHQILYNKNVAGVDSIYTMITTDTTLASFDNISATGGVLLVEQIVDEGSATSETPVFNNFGFDASIYSVGGVDDNGTAVNNKPLYFSVLYYIRIR